MEYILESKTLTRDFISLFLGKKIGQGMSRAVYVCAQDNEHVIKIESESGRFQNVLEWEVWQTVKDSKLSKYFAPCVAISDCGTVLIQKRARPIRKEEYPKKIPVFFTDTKYQNFGIIGKQFVCLDYGTVHIPALSKFITNKLKKAEYWNTKT